jgi:hypothetical protein
MHPTLKKMSEYACAVVTFFDDPDQHHPEVEKEEYPLSTTDGSRTNCNWVEQVHNKDKRPLPHAVQ